MLAKNQQGVAGFNAEKLPGFFWNDDLTTITNFCGAENFLCVLFSQNMFTACYDDPLLSHFSYFSHREYIGNRSDCQVRSGLIVQRIPPAMQVVQKSYTYA